MDDETDRPRGILAPIDREYLLGEKEYDSRQAKYERKRTIQERVENGLKDFTILFDHLEYEEIRDLIGAAPTPRVRIEDSELEAGFRDAVAFSIKCTGSDTLFRPATPSGTTIDRVLEDAIERVAWQYGFNIHEVDLNINAEKMPEREWLNDLKEGRDLPPEAFAYFANRDDIEIGEIQDEIRSMLFDDTQQTASEDAD